MSQGIVSRIQRASAAREPGPESGRRRRLRALRRSQGELAFLSIPGLTYVIVLFYFPMFGIIVAFQRFSYPKGILGSEFVGFENFESFFGSATFVQLIRNTVLYNVVFVLLGTALAIAVAILAFLLRERRWVVGLYQVVLFLPYFLSFIVIGIIVKAFLSYRTGFVPSLIADAGGERPNFYEKPAMWIFIIVLVELWQSIGFSSLLYFTGLLGIDPAYFEAAEMDGASKWQVIRHILVPLLAPLIGILLILAIGGLVSANFALFYFIPDNSPALFATTDVINTWVFRSLSAGEIGSPAAVGLFQAVVGLLLVLLSNYIVRRINPDASLF